VLEAGDLDRADDVVGALEHLLEVEARGVDIDQRERPPGRVLRRRGCQA